MVNGVGGVGDGIVEYGVEIKLFNVWGGGYD